MQTMKHQTEGTQTAVTRPQTTCAFPQSQSRSLTIITNTIVIVRLTSPLTHRLSLSQGLVSSLSSSPRLKGRVRPPGRQGPPVCYGLLEGSEVR